MTRLAEPWGSRIDRARPVQFRFEGRTFEAYAGDTIASALAVNGQWMLSRSFKYHRPRGAFSMSGAEANTLVQVGGLPNVLADLTPIAPGMEIRAQNVVGSLAHDRDAMLDRLGRFLPVGFYYRTFMGPGRNSWRNWWEPLIRRKAGLGVIDTGAVPGGFEQGNLHCDVLVVGGGVAGLSAALAAAAGGADTILCEADTSLGGAHCHAPVEGMDTLIAEVQAAQNLRVMTGTTCNGWYADNWLPLIQGRTLWRTRAAQVIFATGGIEQPAVFRNNDLPGIMTGGAAQRLMRLFAVRPGQRAVVLAGTPEGLTVAADLREAGVTVAAVILPRPLPGSERMLETLRGQRVRILDGEILEARGRAHLAAVRVGEGWIECDLLAVSVGRMPSWQLPCQAGARMAYDDARGLPSLRLEAPGVTLAGSVNGTVGHAATGADGRRAAARALSALGRPVPEVDEVPDSEAAGALALLPIVAHPKGRDFIDFDEDLQVKDLQNAVKEGYDEIELLKRFTTVGMGPSQGRHSAMAAARVLAEATGRPVSQVGVTTARPPVGPETLGVLAGPSHVAERRTALHGVHMAAGAEMRPVGAWWRPYLYPGTGDRNARIASEVAAVRESVGVLDVSTLGKLEVRGPDAGVFLDRLYTMAHANQPVGRVRYCLMLNEAGCVIDDGVAWRMAEDGYYVTATTGAVARVYAEMAFWNAQWRLAVDVANLTSAFVGLNVTGPKARKVMQALDSDIDFSRDGFGYLEGRAGRVSGIPVRVMRIGFTGELSFELHCPQRHAVALWDAVMRAGRDHGLRPYGLEASRILRLEKGHILIGQDTDALSSPDEIGFGWALSKKKPFFVGKRSVEMRRRLGETRRLVGLSFAPGTELPGESCLVLREGAPVGHVTSVTLSATLGHGIALAYVHVADAEPGALVEVRARSGRVVVGTVVGHAFYDPGNERQAM